MKDIADLIGRVFLSVLSLYQAFDTLIFKESTLANMDSYGITMFQNTLLWSGVAALFIGCILVMIGYYARIGALILAFYWLILTLIMYSFWTAPPDQQAVQALKFMNNLAMIGGFLVVVAHGAGRFSVKRLLYVMRLPK